jgi:Helix-turn-helix
VHICCTPGSQPATRRYWLVRRCVPGTCNGKASFMSNDTETPGPGRNVALLRKQRGMSQVKLAREAGVSLSLLSKIEVGTGR